MHFETPCISSKSLQGEQEVTAEQITELKADKTGLDAKIVNLQQDLQSRTNEMNREIRRKGIKLQNNTFICFYR